MKYIFAFAFSAILFASCQTSQGCGCLRSDAQQAENSAVAVENENA